MYLSRCWKPWASPVHNAATPSTYHWHTAKATSVWVRVSGKVENASFGSPNLASLKSQPACESLQYVLLDSRKRAFDTSEGYQSSFFATSSKWGWVSQCFKIWTVFLGKKIFACERFKSPRPIGWMILKLTTDFWKRLLSRASALVASPAADQQELRRLA